MGLFIVYFCPFIITTSLIQIDKSLNGVLGIRTRSRSMVGADDTMELLRPSIKLIILIILMDLHSQI